MSQLIDRRLHISRKSLVNRQRFLRRYKSQIKKAVLHAIAKQGMTDREGVDAVNIPIKDLCEPRFKWGTGGVVERVFPGNREFSAGDEIQKPPNASETGASGGSSQTGEGDDPFKFQLSREEFLDLYFDGLALPDLVKKESGPLDEVKLVRSGIVSSGTPVNINVARSMRYAASRRVTMGAAYKRKLACLETQLAALATRPATKKKTDDQAREDILAQIEQCKRKLKAIPFIDDIDLRYNHRVKITFPTVRAVMFCIIDVSGSMDEIKKALAKQFFILLYLFLIKNYEKIELVFIRHHTAAKEVDEQTFFYARETGGTVVSSALELLVSLIESRYNPQCWNIYVAQASDGDNWNADSPYCQQLMLEKIMPLVQYYVYVEIMPRHHQSLWAAYETVIKHCPHFAMKQVDQQEQVYPIFRELFQRRTK